MGRKRGGLAGFWDRSKKIIKPIATLGAGMLTGGLGGAVVGGLMGGLDRPGKSGIGFDLKQGALGAASGYGMGKVGEFGRGALASRFGGSAASTLAPPIAPPPDVPLGIGAGEVGGVGAGVSPGTYAGMTPTGVPGAAPVLQSAMGTPGGLGAGGMHIPTGTPGIGSMVAQAPKPSGLSGLWNAVKPQMGTAPGGGTTGNLGAYGSALSYLGNRSAANADARRSDASSNLTDAQAAEMQYELEQRKKKDASMEELRRILGQSMPDFGTGAPTSAWNR